MNQKNNKNDSFKVKQLTSPIYEVCSGQILLSKRKQFFHLHEKFLLPLMKNIHITPILFLNTEVGRYCRFLNIYKYKNMAEYEIKTNELLSNPKLEIYYKKIEKCIAGSITIELMSDLHYFKRVIK